jgi:hypothetical protein
VRCCGTRCWPPVTGWASALQRGRSTSPMVGPSHRWRPAGAWPCWPPGCPGRNSRSSCTALVGSSHEWTRGSTRQPWRWSSTDASSTPTRGTGGIRARCSGGRSDVRTPSVSSASGSSVSPRTTSSGPGVLTSRSAAAAARVPDGGGAPVHRRPHVRARDTAGRRRLTRGHLPRGGTPSRLTLLRPGSASTVSQDAGRSAHLIIRRSDSGENSGTREHVRRRCR